MIEILYYAFIFPLQSVLGFALESLFGAIKSHGLSIIFLSLIINLILLKLSKIAESKAHKTNVLKAHCDSKIAEFKRVFKGAELQSYIRTLYKQRHYHPIFALSALGGLALQVPFFIAILFLLQDFEGIKGESFLWISDLSAPDSVLGVHILPILMTIISLINVWIVAKDRGARIQGIIIAIIFLVLLYKMPSALVLYWTTNMAFSLCNSLLGMQFRRFGKFRAFADFKSSLTTPKIPKNYENHIENDFVVCKNTESNDLSLQDFRIYCNISIYAILCIAFLVCIFIPYALYNTDITQFDSTQTFATLSVLFGVFVLVSFVIIYAISFIPKRFSNFVAFILSLILFNGIVYSFILVGDYGAMDHFILQKAPETSAIQIFEFIAVLTLGIALVAFSLKKLIRVWQIVLLTLFIVSGVNAFQIIDKRMESAKVAQENIHHSKHGESEANNPNQNNADILDSSATKSPQNDDAVKPPYENELFSYSKTQKNIVVLVLDMFSGSHTPYILEQFPHFKEQLDGFVLFPNTISTTNSTIHSIATLIGGEYYSAYNMNKRKPNLAKEIDKAFISTANAFANADFSVSLMAFTGSKIDNINAQTNSQIFTFDAESEVFLDYYIHSVDLVEKVAIIKNRTQNIILGELLTCGIFIFAPKILRSKIYNNGKWLFKVEQKILDIFSAIKSASSFYTATHTLNTNATKPTFKFLHSYITHLPYGMYFHNNKCEFFSDKTAWEDYPHKATMYYPNKGRKEGFYQHFDAEACALKYVADFIETLKNAGIYDNTQIFVVSDHSGNDNINIPILDKDDSRPDTLLLFKDFGAKGALKIDNRLMANYDIVSIFCANLKNGCPNVPKNILQNYPTNREIIHTVPTTFILERHQENEWLITKAYKVRKDIYNAENWVDISDSKYGIVNVKK